MNPVQQSTVGGNNTYCKELDDFLASETTSIESLLDYPTIAKAFMKANSTLPSSAAVERLFSIAGMILTPRRCKMSDVLFDRMIFLKCR